MNVNPLVETPGMSLFEFNQVEFNQLNHNFNCPKHSYGVRVSEYSYKRREPFSAQRVYSR